ncbi:MAG: (2Fe-2S)-binding protein [Candidatus Wallbacteria bacterium]|nr:(2Fe-2S)-binding protein [Candidatus Wallbacteria bacterium]
MKIGFKVNGKSYKLAGDECTTLLELLRDKLNLVGTKEGCGKGECGACTVLLDGRAVNSCLVPATQAQGKEIITVEGLEKNGVLHPLQRAFISEGAVQCGFCTPGMLISAYALLMEKKNPTEQEIKTALSGNLCRCTGYDKIVKAVIRAALEIGDEH